MTVTNQNLIVSQGGGHQVHYPIWKDDSGVEYISLNRETFVKLADQNLKKSRRETVERK